MGGPCRNRTEPHRTTQKHREPRKTEEDDSLKWDELTVFLKFIQTYLGRPSLCVDGHVSCDLCVDGQGCVDGHVSVQKAISANCCLCVDGNLCVDGHLSLPSWAHCVTLPQALCFLQRAVPQRVPLMVERFQGAFYLWCASFILCGSNRSKSSE